MIKKKDEFMEEMFEKATEKNNFEIHRMKRQTKDFKGWKTVARKTRKPTTFQAGIEKLLKPQVTEVAMPPPKFRRHGSARSRRSSPRRSRQSRTTTAG